MINYNRTTMYELCVQCLLINGMCLLMHLPLRAAQQQQHLFGRIKPEIQTEQ